MKPLPRSKRRAEYLAGNSKEMEILFAWLAYRRPMPPVFVEPWDGRLDPNQDSVYDENDYDDL